MGHAPILLQGCLNVAIKIRANGMPNADSDVYAHPIPAEVISKGQVQVPQIPPVTLLVLDWQQEEIAPVLHSVLEHVQLAALFPMMRNVRKVSSRFLSR